ncbi:MAG TPA: hypothetical protein VHE83_06400 [Mycobacteriales bacterium]|nr:hypothetical protein [Mycobacteriales bacterium]
MVAGLGLVVAVSGAAGTASAASAAPTKVTAPAAKAVVPDVQLAIPSVTNLGPAIPRDFLGISYEAASLPQAQWDPTQSNLARLIGTLGPGVIRFGGSTLDANVAWTNGVLCTKPSWASVTVTKADLQRLALFAQQSGWRVILGVNFGHFNPTCAGDEARVAQQVLGDSLVGVEIGNEPEAYVAYGLRPGSSPSGCSTNATSPSYDPSCDPGWPASDSSSGPENYAYVQGGDPFAAYTYQVQQYRNAIQSVAPGVAVLGPASNGAGYLNAYAAVNGVPGQPLTSHVYATGVCPNMPVPSISSILGGAVTGLIDKLIKTDVGVGNNNGMPVRIAETNNVACGGEDGVSNVHASALWAANTLGLAATDGASGINFHAGRPGVCGDGTTPWYTPICASSDEDLANGIFTAQPEWYAMEMYSSFVGTRVLSILREATVNVRAYATVDAAGVVRVMVDDMAPTGQQVVHLKLPPTFGVASETLLTGLSLDARFGTAYGGQTARSDGTFGPVIPQSVPDRAGDLIYTQPAGSVAVLTLSQACTLPKAVGMSLAAATKALTQRGCTLGAVNKVKPPKRHKPFLVAAQQFPPNRVVAYLSSVKLRLVAKPLPKPKKKRTLLHH